MVAGVFRCAVIWAILRRKDRGILRRAVVLRVVTLILDLIVRTVQMGRRRGLVMISRTLATGGGMIIGLVTVSRTLATDGA